MDRCRIQMDIPHFQEIEGKIISKEEGEKRFELQENYLIINDEFVRKDKLNNIISEKKPPIGIVATDPAEDKDKFNDWLSTNSGFIEGLSSTVSGEGSKPTVLSDIQRFLIDSNIKFLAMNKCRQFGFSWMIALRALVKAMLQPKSTSIFVSYNDEESKEKIRFARECYESLPSKYQLGRRLKYDNKGSLVFERMGKNTVETRILSFPQRIIRGKGNDIDVILDELSYCIHAREIYKSAMPVLSRGQSTLWIGGTPKGKDGIYYEIIANQDDVYNEYTRITAPWWVVPEFCNNVEEARVYARNLTTEERLRKYAKPQIIAIRRGMVLDDFQQEYECEFLDESYAYFPWDLIWTCVPIMNPEQTIEYDIPAAELNNAKLESGIGIEFYKDFDEFMVAVDKKHFKNSFLGGLDVGRTSDSTETSFIEEDPVSHRQKLRCMITMKNIRLPDQRERIKSMFERLGSKLIKFGVDNNGIGMNIAEDLEDVAPEKVEKLAFNSNEWKEEACRRFRFRMEYTDSSERKYIEFPLDREFLGQVHSIKRILLPSGVWRFDAEKNSKHHGDKFWSVVAASEMGFPISETQTKNDFDSTIFKKENPLNKRKTVELVTSKLSDVMKFNPWGGPRMHGNNMDNILSPRSPFSVPSLMGNTTKIFR